MNSHYLIFGDALDILPKINKKFDAVIVDPPYNTANKNTKILKGRKARSSDFGKWDYFSDDEYLLFTDKWIKNTKNKVKESGNLLIFSKLEYISDIKRIYEKHDFKHHATIIWHKTNPAPQIRKTGFLSSCEAILWATKGFNEKKIDYTFNFTKQNEMHNHIKADFVETPICMGNERTKHPTQKPAKVLEHLLKIFTNENDWVLDCFAGSGTLQSSADQLKRNSISIENDNEYFEIMKNRAKKNNTTSKIVVLKNKNQLSKLKF
ncbi:MAG TPA: site-specific DNA-methyltransferase [Candidatus Moranbacteria bacterium]|nr:site-specific DNA-methyltransferase [Candidatus Moranbacteria bacterium]HRZ33560.1 site-specific DNA-methyltransferase [Candidatus Moranbacteria bacterium]